MNLTDEEKQMLNGEYGEGIAKAMDMGHKVGRGVRSGEACGCEQHPYKPRRTYRMAQGDEQRG